MNESEVQQPTQEVVDLVDFLDLDAPAAPAPQTTAEPVVAQTTGGTGMKLRVLSHSRMVNQLPGGDIMDLLGDLDISAPAPAPVPQIDAAVPAMGAASTAVDPFGFDDFSLAPTPAPAPPSVPDYPVVLSKEQFNGMEVRATMARENGVAVYKIAIVNSASTQLSGFMLQFNKNSFGLQPADQVSVVCRIRIQAH